MARPLDTIAPVWIPAGAKLQGGYTTPVIDQLGQLATSVTFVGTGTTAAGTWQVWESNFPNPTTANSIAVVGASATVSGTPGVVHMDLRLQGRYVFMVFTDTGSSADARFSASLRTTGSGTV